MVRVSRLNIAYRFGWTGFTSSIHWMVPIISGVATGTGIFLIFLQCFNYIVDCYPTLYGLLDFLKANQITY